LQQRHHRSDYAAIAAGDCPRGDQPQRGDAGSKRNGYVVQFERYLVFGQRRVVRLTGN
jgi:hypothetical protein